jgi:hypothetical protein
VAAVKRRRTEPAPPIDYATALRQLYEAVRTGRSGCLACDHRPEIESVPHLQPCRCPCHQARALLTATGVLG